ncbi:Fumarylacetoacetate (FAA) hydrolase family [Popillia japonica]|uniref:oxaloacetate tautomerase n=1 Tax=Popillia japonica TaxID=7064 RepID=A0AAW1LST0_POPJA
MSNLVDFVKTGKKIVAAAINYKAVIKQRNLLRPEKPIFFLKPTTSYITEGQAIKVPENFQLVQEAELGVIIGKTCKNVPESDAMSYVGGYCLALDMTASSELKVAREKGGPWCIGKGFDTSCPVSRFITLEELGDPHNVEIWCKVNGELRQSGNTNDLIFNIPQLISFITKYMTLEVNDLVLTGTPPGNLPVSKGDTIEAGFGDIINFRFNIE